MPMILMFRSFRIVTPVGTDFEIHRNGLVNPPGEKNEMSFFMKTPRDIGELLLCHRLTRRGGGSRDCGLRLLSLGGFFFLWRVIRFMKKGKDAEELERETA